MAIPMEMGQSISLTPTTERICDVDTSHSNRHYRRRNKPQILRSCSWIHTLILGDPAALFSALKTQQHVALLFALLKTSDSVHLVLRMP
jgi:hypothetical protein